MSERKKSAAPQPPPPIDTGVLVRCVMLLILLFAFQGMALTLGVNKAMDSVSAMARPDRQLAFFYRLALVLLPLAGLSAAVGAYIARIVSDPLGRMRTAVQQVSRGNLEHDVEHGPREFLREYVEDCRHMLETLRRLLYRDRDQAIEIDGMLEECQKRLQRQKALDEAERAELGRLLTEARGKLSVVNEHFLKGRSAGT